MTLLSNVVFVCGFSCLFVHCFSSVSCDVLSAHALLAF